MDSLDTLALKYGTDKSSRVHWYTRHYETYLEPLRNEPIKLLEIGIQSGASLRMWKEYFPNAQIYGLDYYDCKPFEDDRIKVIQGNQRDLKTLEKVSQIAQFDVIIDDGSHKNADVLASFDYLFPRLAPGGMYVIEDFNLMYWGKTHNVGAPVMVDRVKQLVDEVNSGGKSGIGDIKKDANDGEFRERGDGKMTWWEKNVRFVHLYRSLVFVGKYENYY